MKIEKIKDLLTPLYGDFNDLSVFNFPGVYILYDENGEVVYIGSAYTRNIEKRLKQYITTTDSGNTLVNKICKVDYGVKTASQITDKKKEDAIKKIKTLKIMAIRHEDLEYRLIREYNPKYNTNGKNK